MPFTAQSNYTVRFEWGLCGLAAVTSDDPVVIVVDVLSFSTAVSVVLARGAVALPYLWGDARAAEYARERDALLAGPRAVSAGGPGGGRYGASQGVSAAGPGEGPGDASHESPGPDSQGAIRAAAEGAAGFSLSPTSLRELPRGARIVLPSPNGSSICFAARASTVLTGSLRNRTAAARLAQSFGRPIAVIAAGERWPDGSLRAAVEDLLGAGAILALLRGAAMGSGETFSGRYGPPAGGSETASGPGGVLTGRGATTFGRCGAASGPSGVLSPEAEAAVAAFVATRDLGGALRGCASGVELTERGFDADVMMAAEVDADEVAAVLRDGKFSARG